MKIPYLVALAVIAAAPLANAAEPRPAETSKPDSARWQIQSVVYGMTTDGKVVSRAENTILIDTETGRTWILWPAKDVPFSWIELPQRKEAATIRKPE